MSQLDSVEDSTMATISGIPSPISPRPQAVKAEIARKEKEVAVRLNYRLALPVLEQGNLTVCQDFVNQAGVRGTRSPLQD